jgi:hypothetical protein
MYIVIQWLCKEAADILGQFACNLYFWRWTMNYLNILEYDLYVYDYFILIYLLQTSTASIALSSI